MKETVEQAQARLRKEREMILNDYGRPGFQLILLKLNETVDQMQADFWRQKRYSLFSEDGIRTAQYLQVWQDIVKDEIPRMMNQWMNIEREAEKKWDFFSWLRTVGKRFKRG